MLAKVAHLAALEVDVPGSDHLFAAFPLVVDDRGGRQVDDLPTCILDAPAPIQFLRVHEKTLVQTANLFVHLAPDKKTGPNHPVHSLDGIIRRVGHVVSAQDPAVGPPFLHDGALHQCRGHRGEATT